MNEDYRLRRLDEFNWTLDRRVLAKKRGSKGKKWKSIGYFPSLDQAALRLFDRLLLSGESSPLIRDLIREVQDARDHIVTLILRQPRPGTVASDPEGVGEPGMNQMSRSSQGIPARPNELSKAEIRKPIPSTSLSSQR